MDIRAARLNPATLALLNTTQVSQYELDETTGNFATRSGLAPNAVGAQKTILPFLPQYGGGTISFHGDSDDLIVPEGFTRALGTS
jgi:hypothetical protein